MKLRIRGNTVRLRLTRGEVEALGEGRAVVEETHFPDGQILRYQLSGGAEQQVSFKPATESVQVISITVPQLVATAWVQDETKVGINGDKPLAVGSLEVLIEKDFTCVTPRAGEEELDTFPNPNAINS